MASKNQGKPASEYAKSVIIDEEITLKKLQVFLLFLKLGSLAETAHALGQSVVSVHRALHSLESGLRCSLFKKNGRSLVPLNTAITFADFAAEAVRSCAMGIEKTQEIAGFKSSRISLGCAYSLTVRPVPQLLYGLKSRRPQLDVDLHLGSSKESLDRLRAGEVDAAIVITVDPVEDKYLLEETIFEDEIFFAAPLKSKFSGRKNVDLHEARKESFVLMREDYLLQDRVRSQEEIFAAAGFEPQISMLAGNLFAMANLVAEGVGFGLLPRRVEQFTGNIELIPLSHPRPPRQKIVFVREAARERDPNLLALAAECRAMRHRMQP